MASKELKNRDNWQTYSGPSGLAGVAESNLFEAFEEAFKDSVYEFSRHPKDFKHLYDLVELSDEVKSNIYCPNEDIMKKVHKRGWGICPDFSIKNKETGKIIFGEIKRQDGWVEGKDPNAGRGNAHERMCKLFSPGIIKQYRKISNITNDEILPFWVVFEGDITIDPKRNREIAFWFDDYDKNYFMWRPNMSNKELINHFNLYLKKYLDT